MLRHSKGNVRLLLSSLVVTCPHSMTVERCVSTHNTLVTNNRASTEIDTINARMIIALNGAGTTRYDPREAITKFLADKERKEHTIAPDTYKENKFVRTFFK